MYHLTKQSAIPTIANKLEIFLCYKPSLLFIMPIIPYPYHSLNGAAVNIPIVPPTTINSVAPVTLPVPERAVDMEVRVTAPLDGDDLPVILLSHGQGESNWISSLAGYAPLYDFWAAHGFVVVNPTHLSSETLELNATEGQEFFWQSRTEDLIWILDHFDDLEDAAPHVKGRLDRSRVAVAGHSLGSWMAGMILGATNTDPRSGEEVRFHDERIKAGVILSGVGRGGEDLSDQGRRMVPFYGPDYSKMTTPTLVVYGDEDVSPHLTVRGADWHADPFALSPGPKDLFTVRGGKHGLGGVSGFDAAETLDESPERLGSVQRMTWAYLKSALYEGDAAWDNACKALESHPNLGTLQHKD